MKSLLALIVLLLVAVSFPAHQKRPAVLALQHVTVIDMTGAPPKPDVTVMITGNRITTIGRTEEVSVPRDAQVIDATGKFLIPGLWDMHVHALRRERVDYFLPLFVANGITGIRDVGTTTDGFAALGQLVRRLRAERALVHALLRRAESLTARDQLFRKIQFHSVTRPKRVRLCALSSKEGQIS